SGTAGADVAREHAVEPRARVSRSAPIPDSSPGVRRGRRGRGSVGGSADATRAALRALGFGRIEVRALGRIGTAFTSSLLGNGGPCVDGRRHPAGASRPPESWPRREGIRPGTVTRPGEVSNRPPPEIDPRATRGGDAGSRLRPGRGLGPGARPAGSGVRYPYR